LLIRLYYKLYPSCLAVNPFKVKYLFTNNYFVFSQGPGCPNIQLSNANINCSGGF